MARKSGKRAQGARSDASSGNQAIRESAQKIWLAGLGAFERAKTEGPKMFETLVAQGRGLGERAAGAAGEALKNVREANATALGRFDKLEQVFEDRVSRSLERLGVITGREVEELSRQVRELDEAVRDLMAQKSGASGAKRKRPAGKKRKAAAKGRKPATPG